MLAHLSCIFHFSSGKNSVQIQGLLDIFEGLLQVNIQLQIVFLILYEESNMIDHDSRYFIFNHCDAVYATYDKDKSGQEPE